MPIVDIGELRNAGFTIGLHGHTHKSSASEVELLNDEFVALGTGSLGAGKKERPDGATNQFSVVDIFRNRVHATVFRRGSTKQYEPGRARRYVPGRALDSRIGSSRAGFHSRRCVVDSWGIAKIEVEYDDLRVAGPITLGSAHHDYGETRSSGEFEGLCEGVKQSKEPVKHVGADNLVKYQLEGMDNMFFDHGKWSFFMSNAVALDRGELDRLRKRREYYPTISDHQDVLSHLVAFDYDRLELSLEYQDGSPKPRACQALVERRVEQDGVMRWQAVESEKGACAIEHKKGSSEVRLSVDAPVVGYRYSIVFEPSVAGSSLQSGVRDFLESLLLTCRGLRNGHESMQSSVTGDMVHTMRNSKWFEEESEEPMLLGKGNRWTTHLWSPRRRRLLPVFGEYPDSELSIRYPCGSGVVGHCFRFNRVVTWHKDFEKQLEVVLQEKPEGSRYKKLPIEWVVCVPIRGTQESETLGVVGFAGPRATGNQSASRLERFAQRHAKATDADMNELFAIVNAAFWMSLDDTWEPDDDGDRRYLKRARRQFPGKSRAR